VDAFGLSKNTVGEVEVATADLLETFALRCWTFSVQLKSSLCFVIYLFHEHVFKTCIVFFNMNWKTNIPKDTAVSLDTFRFSRTQ
jgi:hypothetical protein